jgi:isoleucyl-tRNA synthetase
MDIIKDRLYTDGTVSHSRRSAQSALYDIMISLVKILSPILVHTSEEVWQEAIQKADLAESVFLTDWPEFDERYEDKEFMDKWDELLSIRKDVSKALEIARNDKIIGNSLEARVEISSLNDNVNELLEEEYDKLADFFIVSQVELKQELEDVTHVGENTQIKVFVEEAHGEKCERCWKYSTTVGEDDKYEDVCHRCASVLKEEQ